MKLIGKTVAVLLLIFGSVLYGAEKEVVQFGSIKIKVSLEATPAVLRSVGSSGVYSTGGVSLNNHRWLVVHVSYIPGMATVRKNLFPSTVVHRVCTV